MSLDFFRVTHREVVRNKMKYYEIFPEFIIKPSKDLMTRGGKFYAVFNRETGFWEQDEFKIQEYVDAELKRYFDNEFAERLGESRFKYCNVKTLGKFNSRTWIEYKTYVSSLPDHYRQLDDKIFFAGQVPKQSDYVSKHLDYELKEGPYDAWDTLVGTLYSEEEKQKLEWAIGAIISGDSKDIQKFIVLYGDPGAGKGTIIKIIQNMFPGYYEMFDARTLSSSNNAFAFEQFRSNPLIALQTDGDLSRIEDNTKINSLVSHETVVMNEKRKQSYNFTPRCFLFMASNKAVQITDSKSGILRRLIDVSPTGNTLPKKQYDQLMGQIGFQFSGIAWHCLDVYHKLGKNYYNAYKPFDMMAKTNAFYNFVLDNYDIFEEDQQKNGGTTLEYAYDDLWTNYVTRAGLEYRMPRYKFKEELKNYFNDYVEIKKIDGKTKRGWYCGGLKKERFENGMEGRKDIPHNDPTFSLVLDQKVSLLDEMLKDCQAQYGEEKPEGGSKPKVAWSYCKTTLKDIDTHLLHFVRVPKNHIVIDFDLKNEKGEKDVIKNLEAADKWPRTYAEYSQGGKGIHLHYIYEGDPEELESLYAKDIEIKVYTGKSSLRRRLSLCNNIPVARLSGGLPKKEMKDDEMVDFESVKDEMHIRNIVAKCLRKDIQQPYTAPAMSLIKKTLDDAYEGGKVRYDIRDMRPAISAFAAKSHNQKETCMKMVNELKFCDRWTEKTTQATKAEPAAAKAADPEKDISRILKETSEDVTAEERAAKVAAIQEAIKYDIEKGFAGIRTAPVEADETIVFFDIEVFPNLFLVNWKEAGEGKGVVRMINPTRSEISDLLHRKLVGFNCRRYDNHILYGRLMGYDNAQIYRLSQRIIGGSANAMFGNAYDISYTDVYDFAAKKQSLKKWEIELGIHHKELGLPWDQPVPEARWAEVAAYCDNDVIATEAVFNALAGDFNARKILAEIAGMKVNDTTNQLTTRIIFGDDPKPQAQFNYPDLKAKFPGYRFEGGKSYYRHEIRCDTDWELFVKRIAKEYPEEQIVGMNRKDGIAVVDEIIGEGGRVYANPGIHYNVTTFDVASMHPSSIIAENGFGKYTERFKQLLDIRILIKHKDFEKARKMLDGRLAGYLNDERQAKALSQALKIAINSVYGLTAAGFENKFKDPRNKDNWVAKRGALFIETLRLKVGELGGRVVHIKTDSIKVEEPTKEISDFILDYGKQYGYTFEVEDIYERMCLVNDAVYIALRDKEDPSWKDECRKAKDKAQEKGTAYSEPTRWTATGAQFQHPYVFKTLFSGEKLGFRDLCETKTVTSALYLDMNEKLSDPTADEKDLEKTVKRVRSLLKTIGYKGSYNDWRNGQFELGCNDTGLSETAKEQIGNELKDLREDILVLEEAIGKCHNYVFVGKAGSFCPVRPGCGGGILCREKDGKFYAATGSKGYRWLEGETIETTGWHDLIDMGYFEALAEAARKAVGEYGSFEAFVKGVYIPWEGAERFGSNDTKVLPPCGNEGFIGCVGCPFYLADALPEECANGHDISEYVKLFGAACNRAASA